MSGRKQEVIDFLWPLQREGTWNERENRCVDEPLFKLWCWTLLKVELFSSGIGSRSGAVEDGIFGVFINLFTGLYLYTSAGSVSTGKFQSIQNYQLFSQ